MSAHGPKPLDHDLVPVWADAVSFGARAHEGQRRKDGRTPYAAHPMRVALWVRDVFGCDDPVCLVAALLHDVIEDTTVDRDELDERFGPAVGAIVAALSKDARLPEPEREASYDAGLAGADWRARLIKLADVADNLCDGTGDASARIEKCRRAIALGEPDAAEHSASSRAIATVRALVERVSPTTS